jgi:hypothetical protein
MCERFEVTGLPVGEADLGPCDAIGVPHSVLEVLSFAARSEQRQGSATATSDYAHSHDATRPRREQILRSGTASGFTSAEADRFPR